MTFINLKFDSIDRVISIAVNNDQNSIAFADNINQYTAPADYINQHNQPRPSIVADFLIKAAKGNRLFNFNWNLNDLSQDNFNMMHRDIENFNLSDHSTDETASNFFVDLHEALHQAERAVPKLYHRNGSKFSPDLQLKWFGPSHPWPTQPTFVRRSELVPGDVIADYPHVGKTPLNTMKNNDFSTLETMCKIPDAFPPSFHIILDNKLSVEEDNMLLDQLLTWYDTYSSRLNTRFTKEEMLLHYGEFKIGTISLDDADLLKNTLISSCSIVNY